MDFLFIFLELVSLLSIHIPYFMINDRIIPFKITTLYLHLCDLFQMLPSLFIMLFLFYLISMHITMHFDRNHQEYSILCCLFGGVIGRWQFGYVLCSKKEHFDSSCLLHLCQLLGLLVV